jgi:hypothetical protein
MAAQVEGNLRRPSRWRTPTAIALAVAIGVPVGVFLKASAVPFGPVLLGWFVTLVGAIVASAALCILATHSYIIVGLGYAAGVAMTVVIATVGVEDASLGPLAQFAIIFTVVGCASLLGSLPCASLKSKDKRAKEPMK